MAAPTTLYFVDGSGKYLGQFVDGAVPPTGAVEVPNAPPDASCLWTGSAWGPLSPAAVARAAQAGLAAALALGIAITSTGTPALNATYGTSQQDEINITGLQVSIGQGVFPGYYRDAAGVKHTMSPAQFTTIAEAALAYIEACDDTYSTLASGGTASWPSNAYTIA